MELRLVNQTSSDRFDATHPAVGCRPVQRERAKRFPRRSLGGNHRPASAPSERRDQTARLGFAVPATSRFETAKSRRAAGTLHFPDPFPPDSHPLVGSLN